jgi:hypothetical protein
MINRFSVGSQDKLSQQKEDLEAAADLKNARKLPGAFILQDYRRAEKPPRKSFQRAIILFPGLF